MGEVRSIGLATDERMLIKQLYPPLQRYAAVVAPADVDPEDLVQEAFLRVIRKGSVTDLEHPNAYLRKTVCNLASNNRRRFSRQRRALTRLSDPSADSVEYPSDLDDLLRLRPVARAVLYLHEIEGRTFAEIAAMLGKTEVGVRSISSRAQRQLRVELMEEVGSATA